MEDVNKQIRTLVGTLRGHRNEYAEAINALYAQATEAQLLDANSEVNQKGKEPGKRVYVTDRTVPAWVYTNAVSPTEPWRLMSSEAIVYTPS